MPLWKELRNLRIGLPPGMGPVDSSRQTFHVVGISGSLMEMEETIMDRFLKTRMSGLLLASASALVLTATAAQAQITGAIDANIPFAFIAGSTKLPAGSYAIRVLDIEDPHVLTIADKGGKVEAFVTTEGAQTRQLPGKTELVFDKVGDREFLSQIWIEGSSEGYQVAKSRMQLKLEKSGASPQSHRLAVTHNKKGKT